MGTVVYAAKQIESAGITCVQNAMIKVIQQSINRNSSDFDLSMNFGLAEAYSPVGRPTLLYCSKTDNRCIFTQKRQNGGIIVSCAIVNITNCDSENSTYTVNNPFVQGRMFFNNNPANINLDFFDSECKQKK